jgi:hypothetical protein
VIVESKDAAKESKDVAKESKNAIVESKNAIVESKNVIFESKNVAKESKDAIVESKDAAKESAEVEVVVKAHDENQQAKAVEVAELVAHSEKEAQEGERKLSKPEIHQRKPEAVVNVIEPAVLIGEGIANGVVVGSYPQQQVGALSIEELERKVKGNDPAVQSQNGSDGRNEKEAKELQATTGNKSDNLDPSSSNNNNNNNNNNNSSGSGSNSGIGLLAAFGLENAVEPIDIKCSGAEKVKVGDYVVRYDLFFKKFFFEFPLHVIIPLFRFVLYFNIYSC